jgi:hypothetical protein
MAGIVWNNTETTADCSEHSQEPSSSKEDDGIDQLNDS